MYIYIQSSEPAVFSIARAHTYNSILMSCIYIYRVASRLFSEDVAPSHAHNFIRRLQLSGRLLRLYTQVPTSAYMHACA